MTTPDEAKQRLVNLTFSFIVALTAWRVIWLYFDRTSLSTDEAQYWFWGQSFSFGAYSKPPLIGWLIRATTELAGQSVFGARFSAPLLHGATAVVIFSLGRRITTLPTAAFAALSYLTLPAVALGSFLITTDTPLLFFAALSLLFQHRLASSNSITLAILLGLSIGLAFLTKYAMIYVILGMIFAAITSTDWRISLRATCISSIVAFLVFLPNLIWVASHNFVTAQHVAHDAEWHGIQLHPLQALQFFVEQFVVMGPILFAAWIVGGIKIRSMSRAQLALYWTSALPVIVVMGQAFFSRALANWGVTFVIAGVLIAAIVLSKHRRIMMASLCTTFVLSLAFPVVFIVGTQWRLANGDLALQRYLPQPDIVEWTVTQAQGQDIPVIIANRRDTLSALTWAARDTHIIVNAPPTTAPPQHHWDLLYQFDGQKTPGPALVLTIEGSPLEQRCNNSTSLSRTAQEGFLEGLKFSLITIHEESCLKRRSSNRNLR